MGSVRSLSRCLFLSIFFNEIDVDALEYERMPKYATDHVIRDFVFINACFIMNIQRVKIY